VEPMFCFVPPSGVKESLGSVVTSPTAMSSFSTPSMLAGLKATDVASWVTAVVANDMPVARPLWVSKEKPAAWLRPAASRVTTESVFFIMEYVSSR
jgi:hypothetical protein